MIFDLQSKKKNIIYFTKKTFVMNKVNPMKNLFLNIQIKNNKDLYFSRSHPLRVKRDIRIKNGPLHF